MNFQSTDANATLASFGPNLIPSPYRSVIIVTSISVNLELGEIPLCYIGSARRFSAVRAPRFRSEVQVRTRLRGSRTEVASLQ